MKKEVLIFDFDGVIVKTEDLVLKYVNQSYGINLTPGNYNKEISLENVVNKEAGLNLTFEEFYWDFTRNFTTSFALNRESQLFPYAGDVLRQAKEKYDMYVSTKRNSLGCSVMKFTLKRFNILDCFKGVHFAYSFNEKKEFVKSPKINFISSFNGNVSYFTDDSIAEIEESKLIVPSILFNPSEGKEVKGAWSANNWLEVAELLL